MITAARQIAEAFKQTYESNQSLEDVTSLMGKLVKDEEQSIRMVVMEQIPEIGLFCKHIGEPLKYVVEEEIIPHIITLLADSFTQVRKVTQTAVVTLLEHGVISIATVEERVFPVILKLSDLHTVDDHRPEIEVVTFMSKMAPLVGKSAIVNSYLSSFCLSCEDSGFQVRRVCAMGMAEMAPVVGTVLTEKALLPRFLTLCEDEIWGVRKSCAEVFTTVANVCSYSVRKKCLAQTFVNLLEDHSRWVRVSAFQSLGQLIASFSTGEKDNVALVPDELEQCFLIEMKKCTKIVMEKRNQDLVAANTKKAGAEKENGFQLNGNDRLQFGGSDDESPKNEKYCQERAPDPFDDDDEEDQYDWPSERPQEEKQYSWLLDRSFGPGPDRDWVGEEDWGDDVPMDCSGEDRADSTGANSVEEDDGFEEWKDATSLIPEELHLDSEDEDAVVSRDVEKSKIEENEDRKTTSHIMADSLSPPVVNCLKENKESHDEPLHLPGSSKISWTRNELDERIQIQVGTPLFRNPLSPTPSNSSSGISSLSNNSTTDTSSYNTFQFWRLPIPDLEMDIDMKNGKPTNVLVRAKLKDPVTRLTYSSELSVSLRMDAGDGSPQTESSKTSQGVGVTHAAIQAHAPPEIPFSSYDYVSTVTSSENHQGAFKANIVIETTSASNKYPEKANSAENSLSSKDFQNISKNESDVLQSVAGISQDVHRSYYNLYSISSSPGTSNSERSSTIEVKYQKKIKPSNMIDFDDDTFHDRFCAEANHSENMPYFLRAYGETGNQRRLLPTLEPSLTIQDQDVVPATLLKHFLAMAETGTEDSPVENEIPVFCAYTFPAVVLTLGAKNWCLLRDCFEKLATMFQWKIRYTLGASLHEIGRIIGPELTERDLLPFYEAISRDIDEVRSGILTHIAKFTRILREEARLCILDTLKSFLRTDNKNNWRFRFELCQQIEELTAVYDPEDVFRHLCPIALELVNDPIADVRRASLRVITEQVKTLNQVKDWDTRAGGNLVLELILKLVGQLAHSTSWVQRQSFATLSGHLIMFNALDPPQFAQDILPHLITLSMDKVPNIRLAVAQALSHSVAKLSYFADASDPQNSIIVDTLANLRNDVDGDVRYYSRVPPSP